MRPHKLYFGLGLAAAVCLTIIFISCSSNTVSDYDAGMPNDPGFLAIQSELTNYLDSTMSFVNNGLSNIQRQPGDTNDVLQYGPTPGDSIIASYVYENGWHIVSWWRSYAIGIRTAFKDSVQFLDSVGQPQQESDNLASLVFKRNWEFDMLDTSVTHTDLSGHVDITFDGINTGTATINGTHNFAASHKTVTPDSTVWKNFSVDGRVTNLTIVETSVGWNQNCPVSGHISSTVSFTYLKDNGTPVTTVWDISIVFHNGRETVMVVRGNTAWTFSRQVCNAPH